MDTVPFFVNPIGPNWNNSNFQNNYPNVNSMQNESIKNLETRVNHLEREVTNLRNRVSRLENANNHYDNYSSNYQANSYNMM